MVVVLQINVAIYHQLLDSRVVKKLSFDLFVFMIYGHSCATVKTEMHFLVVVVQASILASSPSSSSFTSAGQLTCSLVILTNFCFMHSLVLSGLLYGLVFIASRLQISTDY